MTDYERFATLETEYELFLHKIFDTNDEGVTKPRYPLLVPIEARPGTGETGPNGRPAGEMSIADLFPASLRHSLQRLLIGEMRGEEIVPTLMSMARGYRGSMASFHANSARKAFNSLQSAVTFHAHNVSAHAAMSLVADALDLVVFVDREDDRVRNHPVRLGDPGGPRAGRERPTRVDHDLRAGPGAGGVRPPRIPAAPARGQRAVGAPRRP